MPTGRKTPTQLNSTDTPPIKYHDQYLTIRNRFPRHIPFYTDGSKDTERVLVAAVLINHSYGHRIQDHSSIFTAEAHAILLALECIEHSNRKRFLIFTDSMSCLQALDHLKIDHPIIEEIICKLTSLKASGFEIYLCWLPGHASGPLLNLKGDILQDILQYLGIILDPSLTFNKHACD